MFRPSKAGQAAYGDAILSRYPFRSLDNIWLPIASSSHCRAMAVEVDLSITYGAGVVVCFVNTYFDWTDSVGSQEARRVSARVIERSLCGSPPSHMVLAGDLKGVPASPPIKALQGLA